MEKTNACEQCKMRRKYEENPKSLIARFWHWHTCFCPGWKAYLKSLNEEERNQIIERYHLRKS